MSNQSYVIRPFEQFEDYQQAERVQEATWSATEVVPSNMLMAMQRHGSVALGAFGDDDRLLGFVFSFLSPAHVPGAAHGLSHHSHMAAVLPAWRGRGLGLALKQAQAKAVLRAGYNLMTWTYDPLEARNANLNITKLGGICRTYIRNCYGEMRDPLNMGLPSDRFEVEWWLDDTAATIRPTNSSTQVEPQFIDIPANFQTIKQSNLPQAKQIRLDTRAQFEQAFAAGAVVTGFQLMPELGRYELGFAQSETSGHCSHKSN